MNGVTFCLWCLGAFLVAGALLHLVKVWMIILGVWSWEDDDGVFEALKRWLERKDRK